MSDATQQPAIAYREATPADTPGILALLERAFGFPPDPERFDWVYFRNTGDGTTPSYVAECGGRIVGHNGSLPVRLWHGGRVVSGLYTLEVATDPDFQGRGIFARLGQLTLDGAREHGVAIVRIFPNLNSAPAFYNRLGYTELTPFPVVARLLGNLRPLIAARQPALAPAAALADAALRVGRLQARQAARKAQATGARTVPVESFGPWADRLWESLRDGAGTATVRDARFLQWRYLEGPHRYAILGLDRGAGPVGFAVVGVRPWKGGRAAELMELMVEPGDRAGAELLIAEAVLHAAREGAVALRTWVSPRHPHGEAFRRARFRPLPARLRADYSFGAIVLDDAAADPATALAMDGWTITTGDIEYI
jgi:predicted N-acetyltransferase YhbS